MWFGFVTLGAGTFIYRLIVVFPASPPWYVFEVGWAGTGGRVPVPPPEALQAIRCLDQRPVHRELRIGQQATVRRGHQSCIETVSARFNALRPPFISVGLGELFGV